jgi:hypothetical protein
MSIKARRGVLLVALMVVVSALVLSIGVSSPTEAQTASVPSPAPISGNVSVKATFLHAGAGDAPDPPRVVDLSAARYKPGDALMISYKVAPTGFSYFGCQGPFERTEDVRLLGVFSSSSELLPSSERDRVPGAIDAGEDISVEATWPNNEPVDIPQDFRVTPPSVFIIKIPPSATHLFLGIADSYYIDNCGTGADFVIETAPDTAPPVLSLPADITEEATGPDGAEVTYNATATDVVDGSANVTCTPPSGSTFSLGETTVNCSARDAAGNEAAGSFKVSVTYAWSGTLQPINGGGTPEYSDDTSVFKLGSTVPVKFTLTNSSAGISGAVAKLYADKVTNEVVGTEAETSSAAASSGNLFRYDASSNQYVFNWSTKELTVGTYQLKIDLADGASRTVRVSLR